MGATNNVGMEATRDKEHGTPEHDKLMHFIAKKENWEILVKNYFYFKTTKYRKLEVSFELEKPIYQNNRFLVGVADATIELKYETIHTKSKKWYPHIETILIEIKPNITSVGETIRQINLYSKTINDNNFTKIYNCPAPLDLEIAYVTRYLLTNEPNFKTPEEALSFMDLETLLIKQNIILITPNSIDISKKVEEEYPKHINYKKK